MVCITYKFFRGWGLLVLCVVAEGFCLDVAFTSGGGECLHTTGLCFGRLVTMSSSVLYGGLREYTFSSSAVVCFLTYLFSFVDTEYIWSFHC